ncbi:hypothetical protein BOX15_Mlig018073g1 [Macrostomum lignano]|uniref:SP-RING-type domain-containing protein n=1 Tax=Macrostomum lignano TaxID=282301 RepID=A0A267DPX4_9PLAT|nr:hypothetical protein BOX15_Mlig018073g1 [Macrostomum lignano]
MNPQQVKSVLSMRTRDLASGRTEYAVQVLIRCFHSEAGTQPDAFPPGVNLTVNSQPVLGLPAPLPCRPGSDPVRPGRPVNISGLCRLSASSQANNRIRVSWLHRPSGPGYCLSVSLARVVSSNDLANRLLTLPGRVRPASQTQRQIRQLLLGNGDDDEDDDDAMVAMTTITASLRCPLSCARIQLPVRSDDCRHVQCFDARTYLSMNERRATWRCPCCDRPAPYASLHVDAHFQSVLANAPKSVDVVRFLDDGTWQPAGANAASSSTSASTAASASTYKGSSSALGGANFDSVVIDDDDDDDNSYSAIDEAPPTLKRQKRSDSVDDSPSTICNDLDPGDVIVVDLTADSDSGGDGNGRDCDDSSDSQSDTDTYNNGYGLPTFRELWVLLSLRYSRRRHRRLFNRRLMAAVLRHRRIRRLQLQLQHQCLSVVRVVSMVAAIVFLCLKTCQPILAVILLCLYTRRRCPRRHRRLRHSQWRLLHRRYQLLQCFRLNCQPAFHRLISFRRIVPMIIYFELEKQLAMCP